MWKRLSLAKLEQRMVEQMVVPKHRLSIKYPSWGKVFTQIIFPLGYTVRKR